MRIGKTLVMAVALLTLCGAALAESVHQSTPATKLYTGDGGSALDKGVLEAKKVEQAESEQVARVKGNMNQWGFVNAWFGMPAPAGKTIVRVRIYNEAATKTAKYFLYTRNDKGSNGIGELKIPADAPDKAFISVDVPVNATAEWSGLVLKKADKTDLPSPWIDTISVLRPE